MFQIQDQHCSLQAKSRQPPIFILFYFFNFILFFNFTILYWFCHTSTWICLWYTRIPHLEPSSLLPPHTILLGRPSAPAPSIQYRASNLDLFLYGSQAKNEFYIFFNCWKKVKFDYCFMTHENYMKLKFECPWSFIGIQQHSCVHVFLWLLSHIITELWQRRYGLQNYELTCYLTLYSKNFIYPISLQII